MSNALTQVSHVPLKRKARSPPPTSRRPPPLRTTTTKRTRPLLDLVGEEQRREDFRRQIMTLLVVQIANRDREAADRQQQRIQSLPRRADRRRLMAQRPTVAEDEYIVLE